MSLVIDFKGRLSRLRNRAFFKQLTVEHGTITWPGGIDLDPDVLHWELTGRPIIGADAPWGASKIPMAARQSQIKKRA